MNSPKPQGWARDYAGGLVVRIATDSDGRWRVTSNAMLHRESLPAYPLASMQERADRLAGAMAAGSWRRMCHRCDASMALEIRNRPDSGPDTERSQLWVCSSPACNHAEPADD